MKEQKNKNRNVIQKSKPLLYLWKSPLTLAEFKILDLYLSRIDSHHPENRKVIFEKGEIETTLGVKRILVSELKKRIQHLGIMVQVEDIDEFGGFRSVSLFEEAICHRDEDGLWQIELTCTPQAMRYIFNIENVGYLRYKLQTISNLNSRYSYLLFLYLERNRYRKSWEVDINELRDFLGCNSEFYSSYKYFNKDILRRSQQELEEKTYCSFQYEPLRRGRRVWGIRFTLNPLDLSESSEFFESSKDNSTHSLPSSEEEKHESPREFLLSACTPEGSEQPEFAGADAQHILAVLAEVPLSKMPEMGNFGSGPQLRRLAYLVERYAAMNRAAKTTPIKNRASYLIALIKQDVE